MAKRCISFLNFFDTWTVLYWIIISLSLVSLSSSSSNTVTWSNFKEEDVQSNSFSELISTDITSKRSLTAINCASTCLGERLCNGFYYDSNHKTCHLAGGCFIDEPDPMFSYSGVRLYRFITVYRNNSDEPFHCPPENGFSTVTIKDKNYCFLLVFDVADYTTARSECHLLGAHLFNFENNMDKFLLLQDAIEPLNYPGVYDLWIGLHSLGGLTKWRWDFNDKDLTDQQNALMPWEHYPQNVGGTCVETNLNDGNVDDEGCYKEKPYICEMP